MADAELDAAPDEDEETGEFEATDGKTYTFPIGPEDAEQARWLARVLKRKVRFSYATEAWHQWNGIVWAPDKTRDVEEQVIAFARRRVELLSTARMGERRRTAAMKNTRRLFDVGHVRSALEALSIQRDYKTDGSDWDQDPYLVGCKNGILDLRTGVLDEHPDPTCLVTRQVAVDYNPDAKAPRFMKFLDEVTSGDGELGGFFIMWFGYGLFGFTQEQRFLILTGLGRNGKGALVTVMRHVFADYSAKASSSLYMKSRFGSARSSEARSDLIELKGKRIAVMSEPEGGRFNEEMLKAHTGGDPIVARPLYGKEIEWLPTHSITFLTNKPPAVDDIGPSMAARVMVADFRERYEGQNEDKQLYDKLIAESEGVFAALVRGAMAWYASMQAGRGGINPYIPKRVVDASAEYLRNNDPLGRAFQEVFVIERGAQGGARDLYETYVEWFAQQSDYDGAPMTMTSFGTELLKRGFPKKKTMNGAVYGNIRAKTAGELADDVDATA